MHDVYICYSSEDKTIANAVCHALEQEGIRCWINPRDSACAAGSAGEVENAINACPVFLLLSPDCAGRPGNAANELQTAIKSRRIVVPFHARDIAPKPAESDASGRHWPDEYPLSSNLMFRECLGTIKANIGRGDEEKRSRAAKKPMSRKAKILILSAAVFVLFAACAGVFLFKAFGNAGGFADSTAWEQNLPYDLGNTEGNLQNGGMVTAKDGVVFYRNVSDENKLYRAKADGTGKTKLSDDDARNINAVAGWVYYTSGSNGGGIYKVRAGGLDREKLVVCYSNYMTVWGDWIFFTADIDGDGIYKVKTDGTQLTKISDMGAAFLDISAGRVYFLNFETSEPAADGSISVFFGGMYRMGAGGENKTQLSGDYNKFCVSGDFIYYADSSNGYKLSRMKTDGTQAEKLSDDYADNINVDGGWIYYGNESDGGKLYKVRTDGSGRTKLNDEPSTEINVAGNWIYYCYCKDKTRSYDVIQYRMKTDGTGKTPVD